MRLLPRRLLIGAGLLVAAFALTLVAILTHWMLATGAGAGLTAAGRLLRHGPTTVDDFKLYPARHLLAARTPQPFARALQPDAAATLPDGRRLRAPALAAATDTLALLVIRDGHLVSETYAPDHGASAPSQWFSVSKSVLTLLLGMAIDDGLIASLEQPVTDAVPELAGAGFGRVALRHLADMRSGMAYTENDNPFGLHVLLNYCADLPTMIGKFTMAEVPGATFKYKSGDTALLALALQRSLRGETLSAYAQRRLWTPLGMEDNALWSLDREGGLEKAWCCLAGSARDLAKIGRLVIARGRVGDRRLVDAQWLDLANPDDAPRAYAFGWWPAARAGRAIMAAGKDGQFLFVDPANATIAVRLGRGDGGLWMGQWADLFAQLAGSARSSPAGR